MSQRVFFFHYNKPASRSANTPKMTVHYKNICHIVDHIICDVNVHTHHNKRQPHVVLKGKANNIIFIEDVPSKHKTALIT
jgi:hypothetical protein